MPSLRTNKRYELFRIVAADVKDTMDCPILSASSKYIIK